MGDVDTLEVMEKLLDNPSSGIDAPAAFIFEPIQGEGGLNAASDAWMQGVERIARKHGALLIVDDIQSGCGRTGEYFGFETAGIQPELRTQATPLAWAKQALKTRQKARDAEDQAEVELIKEQGQVYAKTVNGQLRSTFVGNVAGCLGETSALALLVGGVYLLIRKTISIHIPAAVLLTTLLFSSIVYAMNPETSITPLSHLCNGGLLLCAFFIATDPVTAPLTKRGMWIFGAGVGALIMLIRVVGEYPEGVMFAVLLMNAVTPLIDRLCKRIPAGGKPDV